MAARTSSKAARASRSPWRRWMKTRTSKPRPSATGSNTVWIAADHARPAEVHVNGQLGHGQPTVLLHVSKTIAIYGVHTPQTGSLHACAGNHRNT
jgi:hypothetical protein